MYWMAATDKMISSWRSVAREGFNVFYRWHTYDSSSPSPTPLPRPSHSSSPHPTLSVPVTSPTSYPVFPISSHLLPAPHQLWPSSCFCLPSPPSITTCDGLQNSMGEELRVADCTEHGVTVYSYVVFNPKNLDGKVNNISIKWGSYNSGNKSKDKWRFIFKLTLTRVCYMHISGI